MRQLFAGLTLILLWHLGVVASGVPGFVLPGPLAVLQALGQNAAPLTQAALVTMAEVLAGLALGSALGAGLAMAMTLSPALRVLVQPVLTISQTLPVFALSPILTLWLGFGLGAKVVVVVLITFFPLASGFHDALAATPQATLDLARLAGASPWRTLIWLRLPHAMPALGSGLRIAATYAPIGAVTGEWVGASEGLGHVMLLANARAKTDLMFAALAVLALLTLALRAGMGRLTR